MANPRVRFMENVIKRRVEEKDKFFSDLVGRLLENERDDEVRSFYVWAIGELGQAKAVPSLHSTIFNSGMNTRAAACRAIGKLGDQESIKYLREALYDNDGPVRLGAIDAMGMIGGKDAETSLTIIAEDEEEPELIRNAAKAALSGEKKKPEGKAAEAVQEPDESSGEDIREACAKRFSIVLIEPEIPTNTGNIARLCAATDSVLHLVGKLGFSLEKLPGARVHYFSTKAGKRFTDVQFFYGDLLVFGKETAGLGDDFIEENIEHVFRIPMKDEIRSLNLANSVSVGLYEALRQNNFKDFR
jgi:tRNA (cytidine/uridine-2'-O-)-methyltransferase